MIPELAVWLIAIAAIIAVIPTIICIVLYGAITVAMLWYHVREWLPL